MSVSLSLIGSHTAAAVVGLLPSVAEKRHECTGRQRSSSTVTHPPAIATHHTQLSDGTMHQSNQCVSCTCVYVGRLIWSYVSGVKCPILMLLCRHGMLQLFYNPCCMLYSFAEPDQGKYAHIYLCVFGFASNTTVWEASTRCEWSLRKKWQLTCPCIPLGVLRTVERSLVVLQSTRPFTKYHTCSLLILVWEEFWEKHSDKSLPMFIISCATEQAAAAPPLARDISLFYTDSSLWSFSLHTYCCRRISLYTYGSLLFLRETDLSIYTPFQPVSFTIMNPDKVSQGGGWYICVGVFFGSIIGWVKQHSCDDQLIHQKGL